MNKSKNKVFDANELAVISEAVKQSSEITEAKVKVLSGLMIGVVIVTFVGFITMIVMVATILIDSFNMKSVSYRDYLKNIETYREFVKTSAQKN
ncbi:MAG: hypothetical protein UW22_C0003G0002 [Candidatus Gottesmanbacteria bacterium GW2011_GWB1_44_11c]|uniref:Uncharacterized protein n=1 Tax=Candidatus Gottesmanbacteria bacterium GW2011_GWB1_44_11c TaxID=1618447 RepID=A0A0G1GWC2_9BACT|nr:MAG: hypothetical protein UW22_C0003G0002 [Candidatus Gottesmanbacteria bacterium GW2011_GWB1_44_11c]